MEDFDALVTGHLTHYTLWYEEEIADAIRKFFSTGNTQADHLFSEFFMSSQNTNFEKMVKVLKGILELKKPSLVVIFNSVCKKIELIRRKRNIMAHGLLDEDQSTLSPLKINVFSGDSHSFEITPSSFDTLLAECETTLEELKKILNSLS